MCIVKYILNFKCLKESVGGMMASMVSGWFELELDEGWGLLCIINVSFPSPAI